MESFSCPEFVLVTKTNVAQKHALNKSSTLKNISTDEMRFCLLSNTSDNWQRRQIGSDAGTVTCL